MSSKHKTRRGIRIGGLLIPSILVLAFLHVAMIFLIIGINQESTLMSVTMQKSASYVTDATSLLAGSSLLSETSTNFVLRPTVGENQPNTGPLMAYANEVKNPRRGPDVLNRFEKSDASKEAIQELRVAATAADFMYQRQLHSLALVTSVYPLPEIPALSAIPIPSLTTEEANWDAEHKMSEAANLLLDQQYGSNKGTVSEKVNACVGILQKISGEQSAHSGRIIATYRTLLWVGTALIITALSFTFIMIYRGLASPVAAASRNIEKNAPLNENVGFREMRLLSNSYNLLQQRRNHLDELLRSAAEKDILTGLGNRYAFDHYLSSLLTKEQHPIGLIIFDVNYLKETNDTYGHKAGDELLRNAASLIDGSFGGNHCYRIGGDEFACVLSDVSPATIESMIEEFSARQSEFGVSISCGYSHAEKLVDSQQIDNLLDAADAKMYDMKAEMHKTHDVKSNPEEKTKKTHKTKSK